MTTLMFDPSQEGFDFRQGFIVQVKGVDGCGYCSRLMRQPGIEFTTLEEAKEYASQANSNGHLCKIHLRWPDLQSIT